MRAILIGNKKTQVTKIINKAVEELKCKIAKGESTHKLGKNIINEDDCIAMTISQKGEEYEFHIRMFLF